MNQRSPSISEDFVSAIVNFPKFLFFWVIGLAVVLMTEGIFLVFACAGAASGLALGSVWVGLAVFFIIYSVARVLGNIADSIGSSGIRVGDAIFHGLTPPQEISAEMPTEVFMPPGT